MHTALKYKKCQPPNFIHIFIKHWLILAVEKCSVPQWWGIIRYTTQVLEYSLRYSPGTTVADYSDSTVLNCTCMSCVHRASRRSSKSADDDAFSQPAKPKLRLKFSVVGKILATHICGWYILSQYITCKYGQFLFIFVLYLLKETDHISFIILLFIISRCH